MCSNGHRSLVPSGDTYSEERHGIRLTEGICSPDPEVTHDMSPLSVEANERFKARHGVRPVDDPAGANALKLCSVLSA